MTNPKQPRGILTSISYLCCLVLSLSWIAPFTHAANHAMLASDPESLLPQKTVLLVKSYGSESYLEAYKQTALFEAMENSEFLPLIKKAIDFASKKVPGEEMKVVLGLMEKMQSHGCHLAVSLPDDPNLPPIPQLTSVMKNCGSSAEELIGLILKNVPEAKMVTIEGREVCQVMIPDAPGVDISLWKEAEHLMLAAGMGAGRKAIAVCTGKFPSLKGGKIAKQMNHKALSSLTLEAWLDLETICEAVGPIPLPPDVKPNSKVKDILDILGINSMSMLYSQTGCKGKAFTSYSEIKMSDFPSGIVKPTTTDTFVIGDLLPLPSQTMGFNASTINLTSGFTNLEKIFFKLVSGFAPEREQSEIKDAYAEFNKVIGIDLKADFLDALGNVVCFYNDPDTGLLGTGYSLAVKVKDAKKLKATMLSLVDRTSNAERCPFTIFPKESHGNPLYVFEFSDDNSGVSFQTGALGFDKDWMIIGFMPQAVSGYFLRQQGKLPKWEPTAEVKAGLAELPQAMQGISYMDVRQGYRLLLNLAYMGAPFLQSAIYNGNVLEDGEELPFHVEDLPPTELVTAPLFPNLSVTTMEGNTIKVHSRSSVGGIPLLSSASLSDPTVISAVAVGTALLLPAVSQARVAAKRSQSKNNLKQQGLAAHNHHDTHSSFPAASVPNPELKTEERLSHFVSMLPYLEQNAIYERLNKKEKWNSTANDPYAKLIIPSLVNPGYGNSSTKDGYAYTSYVGIAGLGKDVAESAKPGVKGGIYNHNKATNFRDITDGTSTTLMLMEVSEKSAGPWMQAGNSSVRSFTQKPYINGPDGFGGVFTGGAQAVLADGSVRFITEKIDPKLLENLACKGDGNRVGEF